MNKVTSIVSFISMLSSQEQQAAAVQEFRFINTQKTSTFEKELNDHAGQGWRLFRLPGAFDEGSIGALLSRAEEGKKYEYKVLAARRISTLDKEFIQASEEGWEFRGLVSLGRVSDAVLSMVARIGGETRRWPSKVNSASPIWLPPMASAV